MKEGEIIKSLDDSILGGIAEIICGDGTDWYRKGYELHRFFRNAGLIDCPNHDGSTRKWWTLDRLREYNTPNDMEKILKRLADPREYKGDWIITQKVIDELNKLLNVEGLRIILEGTTPKIIEVKPVKPDLIGKIPEVKQIYHKPDFSKIIVDDSFNRILSSRWEEALRCIKNGAYLSAIIMMGSILEGVLGYLISTHPKEANISKSAPKEYGNKVKKFKDWTFSEMIDVAYDLGWFKMHVRDFSHILRDYRNMVHPEHQKEKNYYPDEEVCKIAWEVVNAAISNLIEKFNGGKNDV